MERSNTVAENGCHDFSLAQICSKFRGRSCLNNEMNSPRRHSSNTTTVREKELNYEYYNNSILVKALLQLMPGNERYKIMKWMQKISAVNESREEMIVRNEYMWFLLLVLQTGHLSCPFVSFPPACPLRPLSEILPPKIYEAIKGHKKRVMTWSKDQETSEALKYRKPDEMEQWEFFNKQPKPETGTVCYACLFSDFK